ncbi:LAMI_0F02080g1_1 [Lachancea mirantina]|uniref:Topoisomerase 1-associated factor 1 n=1 Tax=Lachancea mirantina TaxID=1230905 RepID=A0A1G4JW75_9SACH|nr:LAMI_0F02080g1_1 [Lachancea mirantina]
MSTDQFKDTELPLKILHARIALLSTAIGGPDHTAEIEPTPYKIGDDCLACLKDLKRWFKLVDDKQQRWDVALAAATYNVLIDNLIPILLDWERKSSLAAKRARKEGGIPDSYFKNKSYHDKIAVNALQLMVLMTWPLILTDQSTTSQVLNYTELKKHQLSYKKAIIEAEGGRALKASLRIALDVIKSERHLRSPKDNVILRLVIHFLRNIAAIEPSELTLTTKKRTSSKGIGDTGALPPNVSLDDISSSSLLHAFARNKVLDFIVTVGSLINRDLDANFVSVPLLELMFYLVKNVNHKALFIKQDGCSRDSNRSGTCDSKEKDSEVVPSQLGQLLMKEHEMKKAVINNTSARHSRFGSLISLQTADNQRLTASGGQGLLSNESVLKKLDERKKWNKRITQREETIEGLPSSFLNFIHDAVYWNVSSVRTFRSFIEAFLKEGFNRLLKSLTDQLTTQLEDTALVHQLQYLLFIVWFARYQRFRAKEGEESQEPEVLEAVFEDTCVILVSQFLRRAQEQRTWALVHASMVTFTELFYLLERSENQGSQSQNAFKQKLFTEERIKLICGLSKTASKHSPPYIKCCVELNHILLALLKRFANEQEQQKGSNSEPNDDIDYEEVRALAAQEGIEFEDALDAFQIDDSFHRFDFLKAIKYFPFEGTVKTYISFLSRFPELENEDIESSVAFLYEVFVATGEISMLFRIDFLILLKDILSSNGLSLQSASRKVVIKFADKFMLQLRERLKKSPSWFVNILFPVIHDRQLGFYQKYADVRSDFKSSRRVVPPAEFKAISELKSLSADQILDFKMGVLISTLIDDGKEQHIQELIHNLQNFMNQLGNLASTAVEPSSPRFRFQTAIIDIQKALKFDSNFRALLLLAGFDIPTSIEEECLLCVDWDKKQIERCTEILVKYSTTTFDTANGLPSRSYLKVSNLDDHDSSRLHDEKPNLSALEQSQEQESSYFKELERGRDQKNSTSLQKGLSRRKKAKKKPQPVTKGHSRAAHAQPSHRGIISKEYISDSDDSDDESFNSHFFENEMYLRWLLDKHQGTLPQKKFSLFGKFCQERIQNDGEANNSYEVMFDGPVPSLEELKNAESDVPRLDVGANDHYDLSRSLDQMKALNDANTEHETSHDDKLLTSMLQDSDLSEYNHSTISSPNDSESKRTSKRTKDGPKDRKRKRIRIDEDEYSE